MTKKIAETITPPGSNEQPTVEFDPSVLQLDLSSRIAMVDAAPLSDLVTAKDKLLMKRRLVTTVEELDKFRKLCEANQKSAG
jgi:hypothetical protein